MDQTELFGTPSPALPPGMRFEEAFLSRDDEAALIDLIERLPLARLKYLQYEALRRVVSYGGTYDFSKQ